MWHMYGAWSNITFDALALSLFGSQMGVDAVANKTKISLKNTQCIQVQVEWACTGKVLSYGFQLSRSEPIVRVGMLIGTLLPPNPLYVAYLHRVFHGHGGRELTNVDGEKKCGDVLKSGDVLVISPGICEVDVDKANNEGVTPTYVAAKKAHSECLQILIAVKADVNKARTDDKSTPTFIAAQKGQAECLQLLIVCKADVDKATTDDRSTPAYMAAQEGQAECLQLLIAYKADLNKADLNKADH